MADDITLTVRVRDMTRGEFAQLRRRMHGLNRDIQQVGNSSNLSSQRADRLSQSIRGVTGRMAQLQRTGGGARHEMDFMRRSMGLLSRDLRMAARSGEITSDEFRTLQTELDNTRLDFDHLDNSVRRHSAVTLRAARADAERARALQAMGRLQAAAMREDERRDNAALRALQDMGRAHAAALREDARREAAIARQRLASQRSAAASLMADRAFQLRVIRAHGAAIREEDRRNAASARAAAAAARAAGRTLAAAMRQQQSDQRNRVSRLAGLSGDDGLNIRFNGLSDSDVGRMGRGFAMLRGLIDDVSGSTSDARRNIRNLGRDLNAMGQLLADARREGNLTRRDFNALTNGLNQVSTGARSLRRSGDMSRAAFRDVRREVALFRSQMHLLNNDGNVFSRLAARTHLFQRGLRDTREHLTGVRRVMNGMGDGLATGLRGGILGTGALVAGMRRLGTVINVNKRWTAILLGLLLLLGPVAQALGALLVVALGGAFIALGALALKGSETVKRSFKEMKDSVASDVRDAAQPMEGFLSQGIDQVTKSVSLMKPALESAFTATGPLISNFFGAFTDLAAKAMPGIVRSLQSMGPAIDGFRQGMGLLGRGIGDMFDAMTRNGGAEALGQVWVTLGDEMRHLLTNIGEFINFSAKSSTATMILVTVFRTLSGVLHLVEAGLSALDSVFGSMFRTLMGNGMDIDKLSSSFGDLGASFSTSGKDAATLRSELDQINQSLRETREARDAVDDLDIPDTMKDRLRDQYDETEAGLLSQRESLTQAIAAAEAEAASKTRDHSAAVQALRDSIIALNETNLNRLDAQSAMEKAIDDAVEKAKELKGKIQMSAGGVLNVDTEEGRAAQEIMSAIAKSTSEYVAKLTEAKAPQADINAAWARGREQLIGLADNLGISKEAITAYADQVLQTPESVTTTLKAEAEGAKKNVDELRGKIAKVDGKEAKSRATVEAFRAMERLSAVESKLNALDGKTAVTTVTNRTINEIITNSKTYRSVHDIVGATGGLFTGSDFTKRGYAQGGMITGPGTGTSDDIFAPWLSNGEFVINAKRTKQYLPLLEAMNKGQLKLGMGFAKGGKVSSETKSARSDLAKQLTISTMGRTAGYKNTEFEKSLAKPSSMSDLVSAINSALSAIKKAFGGKSSLFSKMSSIGKTLIKYEQKLLKVNTALDKAKDKLDDLKQAASAIRTSVAKGVISDSNITRLASGEGKVKVNDILNEMRQNQDKANAFADALEQLKAKGVSRTIIEQVAEAGMDGGGLETAQALMRATPDQIDRINMMQGSIGAAATAAGKTAADALYGAGIQAAQGLVDGLVRNQKAIEAAMMRLAKSMEKSLKKALGIKSPSRVMMAVGDYTAEGFAVGMEKNRNVDTAWTSMLNPKVATAGASWAGGNGGGQITIPVYIGNKMIDEIILDSNRRTVRTRGGNVQTVYGARTR